MSLENAFIEQLAQYIEINYKEYLPVTDENILYEKYAPFVDIPERKELTRDQSMDLQHLLDEAGDSFHEKLFELIDNRYVETLNLLGDFLNHKFEVHIIENPDMVEVQQYDVFYDEFRKIISEIEEQKEKEDQLLVNMASGTPGMKSALLIMATLAEYRFLPIQVSTPQKKSNLEHEERDEYDVKANWELNEDNEESAENRCQEVKCLNLMRLLKIDMIKKHLLSYDYHAALAVGKEIKDELNPVAWKWLQSADARAVLDWERMNRVLPENNGIISAVRQENKKKILFEYLLALDLKVKRGEYADFIRGITPLGVDLLEMVLEQYCQIDIRQYYMKNAKNGRKWSRGRMEGTEVQEIMNARYSSFNYKDVYSRHLQLVIEKKCKDDLLKQRTEELVQIEYNVRNIAAHNIVSATPEWVKEQAGRSVEDILWLLKYICEQVKINTRKENWDSYDYMNKRIIEELDR